MTIKNRKIQKLRGTRNNGRGRKGSRKKGGGKGLGGSQKHKKSWVYKNLPGHFGRDGNASLQKKPKAVNIGYLNDYCETNKLSEVEVKKLGFTKVLGQGKVTKALKITAEKFTEKAKEKIKAAGGTVQEK